MRCQETLYRCGLMNIRAIIRHSPCAAIDEDEAINPAYWRYHVTYPRRCGLQPSLRTEKFRRGLYDLSQDFSPPIVLIAISRRLRDAKPACADSRDVR
jgi:hypothetical protein